MATVWKFWYAKQIFNNHGLIVQQILRLRNTLGYIVDLVLRKIDQIGIPY